MSTKKAFSPFMDIVEANLSATVADIADQLRELASTKVRGNTVGNSTTALRDAYNTVVAILDYHAKRWMPLVGDKAVDFGTKTGSSTGYNQMSKLSVSDWTKRQATAKKANADLLTLVSNGEITPHDIADHQAAIEAERTAPFVTELGFESKADCLVYLANEGYVVA